MTDIIITAVLLALSGLAARSVIKRKGRCSCGCDSCPADCSKRNNKH